MARAKRKSPAKDDRQARLPDFDEPTAVPDRAPAAAAVSEAPAKPRAKPAQPASRPATAATEGGSAGPVDLEGKSVWAIDVNALVFQVFHAIPEMTSPSGLPVNAVYGFTRDLLYLLESKRPDYLFCALDPPGATFRHELYVDYKVHRTEMPDELRPQLPLIRRVLDALEIPALELAGYEADDVLAMISRVTCEGRGKCVIVTNDKDCRQLINDQVTLYNVRKDQMYDAAALMGDWGIRPDQVVDFQALVGDPVDHVPGIALVGPKLARDLLVKYDTLEGVLDNASSVAGEKRRQNLLEGREKAILSRHLVRLDQHVPITIDWAAGRVRGIRRLEALLALFTELGFHRFGEQARALAGAVPAEPATWDAEYRTVDTPEALAALVAEMQKQKRISIDIETTSQWPAWAEIVGYSFAWKAGEAYYVPVMAPAGERHSDPQAAAAALRGVLEDPAIEKVGQNLKYDQIALRSAGIDLRGAQFDTMLASYLLDAGERNHDLDELAHRYLDHKKTATSELVGTGSQQKLMHEVPVALVAQYAAEDADVALRLVEPLAARLEAEELTQLHDDVELPLSEVLADMESRGIRVDRNRLAELSQEYTVRLAGLERDIYTAAGREFNIASPKQLQQVLFDEQRLPVLKRTKSGPSTDVSVLEELAENHPLPAKIIEYRQFAKLKNTYVDALPAMIHPRTGRVHASFHQAVAATGRLSSSDPNLQNIPIRTEAGREIRSAFLPGEPDWVLLAGDYSQIELRVLAHFSGDEALREAFERDEDIHTAVASEVFGVRATDVTAEMRRRAKAVNFGVIYGQSPFGLARALSIEQSEAAAFIDAYFQRYHGVEEFLGRVLANCRASGYVRTILGRKRAIQGVRPEAGRQRSLPERTAINTVVQGSAADLIKLAMLAIHRRLRKSSLRGRMLLQIHDELVFEVPSSELHESVDLIRHEMCSVLSLTVPLKVDMKSGMNWAETEPWNTN